MEVITCVHVQLLSCFICRIKDLEEEQYTQREADIAAGKSIEVLPPAHGGSVRMA